MEEISFNSLQKLDNLSKFVDIVHSEGLLEVIILCQTATKIFVICIMQKDSLAEFKVNSDCACQIIDKIDQGKREM